MSSLVVSSGEWVNKTDPYLKTFSLDESKSKVEIYLSNINQNQITMIIILETNIINIKFWKINKKKVLT